MSPSPAPTAKPSVEDRYVEPRPRWALVVGVVTLALSLVGCSSTAPSTTASAATPTDGTVFDLAVPDRIAALPLVDQAGRSVTLASLHGKTVVLVDFLSLCQEVCPLTSANVRAVSDALDADGISDRVQILEATVDPERDTTTRLSAYQKLFGAKPNWSFVTGKTADIAALWKSFGVAYDRTTTTATPPPKDWLTGAPLTYDVDHQDVVIVIDPDGHERWLIDGTPKISSPSSVPSSLQTFLNDDGHSNETAPADPTWTASDVVAAVKYVLADADPGHS